MMLAAAVFYVTTAYAYGCDCKHGALTKSGTVPAAGWTVAADPRVLPLGSIVHVEGLGERMVLDIGGRVRGKHLDLYMLTCAEAREWGRRTRKVRVLHVGGRR